MIISHLLCVEDKFYMKYTLSFYCLALEYIGSNTSYDLSYSIFFLDIKTN